MEDRLNTGDFGLDCASRLRAMRLSAGLTLAEVASRMRLNPSQVQRRETGELRITMGFLMSYCACLGVDYRSLLMDEVEVPIVGVVDQRQEIHPLPTHSQKFVSLNAFCQRSEHLRALRYETTGSLDIISGHIALFFGGADEVPFGIWEKRCVFRRTDGSQRIGWLFNEDGQIHAFHPGLPAEYNIGISWATPIIAIISQSVGTS